jgi:hypothetical protein
MPTLRKRMFWLALFILGTVAVALTFFRIVWIAMIVAFFLIAIMLGVSLWRRFLTYILVAFGVGLFFFTTIFQNVISFNLISDR